MLATASLLALFCVASPLDQVSDALRVLRATTFYTDGLIGFAGTEPPSVAAYERLAKHATWLQLEALTLDESPIVRCHAIRALAEYHPKYDLVPSLLGNLLDDARITRRSGCCISKQRIGDVMLSSVWNLLQSSQRLRLVEFMMATDSRLDMRDRALRSMRLPERMLPQLRKLARGGDGPATIAVARLQKPRDVALLQDLLLSPRSLVDLMDVLRAVRIHPHQQLEPALLARTNEAESLIRRRLPMRARFWIEAVAALRTERGTAVFATLLRRVPTAKQAGLRKVIAAAIR